MLSSLPTMGQAQTDDDDWAGPVDDDSDTVGTIAEPADRRSALEDGSPDDADAFAYAEPPAEEQAELSFAAGAGIGFHEGVLPGLTGTTTVGGNAFVIGAVSARLVVTPARGIHFGGALSYASSLGQTAKVSAPAADLPGLVPSPQTVTTAARKQEVSMAGLMRFPLSDSEAPIAVPLWFGADLMGFDTDLATPIVEYTLLNVFVRPGLHVPMGPVRVQLTGLAGLVMPIAGGLSAAGYADTGLALGGQLDVEVAIAGPVTAEASVRFKRTSLAAQPAVASFTDTAVFAHLSAAARF